MRQVAPIIFGILVTLGIGVLLGEAVPAFVLSSSLPMLPVLAVQVQSALQLFVAVFAGAIVARGHFVGPAMALTVLGWCAVVYIAYDIARLATDPRWAEFAILNLAGLLFYITAAAVGAFLGGRFYMHRLGKNGAAI